MHLAETQAIYHKDTKTTLIAKNLRNRVALMAAGIKNIRIEKPADF